MVSFVFSANQKPFVICTRVSSFALVLQVCPRVTEELHSSLSQSELSNFFVYIIMTLIQREVWVVRVTELSRDKFIHSYANKKKKETVHLTGAGK